jgi:succinate dehydrogenase / fumarate reductase flavoprotein subunit
MQGLADGYFVLPATLGNYLASGGFAKVDTSHAAVKDAEREVKERLERLVSAPGKTSAEELHKELGNVMWNDCGMARSKESLTHALQVIPELREKFYRELRVPGSGQEFNMELEKAGRIADFFELAELLCYDALQRNESCGGHFRVEYQTPDGEAQRNDAEYAYAAAWEWKGESATPTLHKEPLAFENIHLAQRSYK